MPIFTYQQTEVLINALVKGFEVLMRIPLDGKTMAISARHSECYTAKQL